MIRGICCILLAVAIFAPVVRKLYKWNRVTDEQRVAAQVGLVDTRLETNRKKAA